MCTMHCTPFVTNLLTSALSRQVSEIVWNPADKASFGHMFNGITLRASEVGCCPLSCSSHCPIHECAATMACCGHGRMSSSSSTNLPCPHAAIQTAYVHRHVFAKAIHVPHQMILCTLGETIFPARCAADLTDMRCSVTPTAPMEQHEFDLRLQGTLRCARNVLCTDQQDGAAMPFGDDRGLARFRVLARLTLRHAHRGCLGGAGLL